MNVISFLYELLFDPKRKKKKKNNPELFHSDDFLRPNHPNFRICPKCSIESNTNKEAAKIFQKKVDKKLFNIIAVCDSNKKNLIKFQLQITFYLEVV